MPIPFTQFLRPDGRPVPVAIDRPEAIEALAHRVRQAGGCFEIEVLTTGDVSMTVEMISGPEILDEPTVAIEVVPNGPAIGDAVDRLVQAAAARLLPAERPS